jgi:hypothetical protein
MLRGLLVFLLLGVSAFGAFTLARGRIAEASGCSEVIVPATVPPDSPVSTVLGLVRGNFTVLGIFRYNNQAHRFDALYFATAGAPIDATTVSGGQGIFTCGTGTGTFPAYGF